MNRRQLSAPALAALLAGAVVVAAQPAAADDKGGLEKCYGVAKPGENGCAHAKGLHSCAGASSVGFDGGDWKLVKAGECEILGGAKAPFVGLNPKAPKT